MPIPEPSGESQKEFIGKCMGDEVMKKEFPDMKQRAAICFSKWKRKSLNELKFKNVNNN